MAYQVTQAEVRAWLESGPTTAEVDAVFDALQVIVADPHDAGDPVPARRPTYVYGVPDTFWAITYTVVEQFRTVKIIDISLAP